MSATTSVDHNGEESIRAPPPSPEYNFETLRSHPKSRADRWRQKYCNAGQKCQDVYDYLKVHIGGSRIVNLFCKRKSTKYQARTNPQGVTRPSAIGGAIRN